MFRRQSRALEIVHASRLILRQSFHLTAQFHVSNLAPKLKTTELRIRLFPFLLANIYLSSVSEVALLADARFGYPSGFLRNTAWVLLLWVSAKAAAAGSKSLRLLAFNYGCGVCQTAGSFFFVVDQPDKPLRMCTRYR